MVEDLEGIKKKGRVPVKRGGTRRDKAEVTDRGNENIQINANTRGEKKKNRRRTKRKREGSQKEKTVLIACHRS